MGPTRCTANHCPKGGRTDSTSALICIFLSLCLLSAACAPESEVDVVQNDLTTYLDKASIWAATEAEINNAISAVRRDQFVNDEYVLETLRPAIGTAREYVAELENYTPETEPVVSVHLGYIEAWRAHEFALSSIVDSVERKDYLQLSRSNNELLEAQRSVSDVLAAIAMLLREAGIAPDRPADRPMTPPSEKGGFQVSPAS